MTEQSLKDRTAKGLFWGGISNGLQQIIGVIFGIFFARILSQEDYGIVGTLAIFTGIVSLVQDSGFTSALINKKEIRHKDYNAVFWFGLFVGIFIYIILFFSAPLIALFFKAPELKNISRVLFLWFLIGGIGIAHNAILTKKLMVKEKAKASVSALIISNTVGIILAVNGFSYWALVIQTVIHSIVGTSLIWYYSPWRPTLKFDFSPLKEMISFSSKLLITGIFSVANMNIFSVLLGRFYTKSELGDYTQANKWTTMGHTFIGSIISSVAHPVLAEVSSDPNRQLAVFRKMMRFTSFISFPCMLGLAFVSKELIIITITDKWLASIPIMQLLCIWGAFIPLSSLYSFLFISRGKSDINMWNIIILGLIQLTAAFFTLPHGIIQMVIVFVIINISWLLVLHVLAKRLIKYQLFYAIKDIFPFLLITIIILTAVNYITLALENLYLLLITKILLSVALYIIVMKLSNAKVFTESVTYLLKKQSDK